MSTREPTTVVQSALNWLHLTETWLYDQVESLPEAVENHVVCDYALNLDLFPIERIHVLRDMHGWQGRVDTALRTFGLRRHDRLLGRQLRECSAQLLHSHFGDRGWLDSCAAREAGIAHVVSFYGLDVNFLPRDDPRWRKRYAALFEHVDRVLCEGTHMAKSIVELGCPADRVQVQALGVRVHDIPFVPRTWEVGEPLRVLIAAGFREKKGIPYGLEALARLERDIAVEITIIGDSRGHGRSAREKVNILSVLERRGLRSRTRLLGFVPRATMLEEAYRHHVFLAPSVTASDGDSEGGAPVSIIEMGASGMPVVSTRHCDIPGVILDGVTGLLSDERDVEGLASNLRELAEHPERGKELGRAARRHIESEFDARVQGKRLADIYSELIDARRTDAERC